MHRFLALVFINLKNLFQFSRNYIHISNMNLSFLKAVAEIYIHEKNYTLFPTVFLFSYAHVIISHVN